MLNSKERQAIIELAELVVDLTNKVTTAFDQKSYEATQARNLKIKELLADPVYGPCEVCGGTNCDCWRYEP